MSTAMDRQAVLDLLPEPGNWTEEEYLALHSSRIVELSEGRLEVADVPTDFHQLILVRLLVEVYTVVVRNQLGQVRMAPLRVRLGPGKFREPDLVFMAAAHADRLGEQYWGVPDLVAEILSPGHIELDREIKKREYAQAGIPEYWILDPRTSTVEVNRLAGNQYHHQQTLSPGDRLVSAQLPGLEIEVGSLFASA